MKHVLALACVLVPTVASAENLTNIHEILTTQHYTTNKERIEVPAQPELRVVTYELPPGGALPVHKHLYPRFAYILEGTLEIDYLDGREKATYGAGSFHAEAPEHWHYGRNVGKGPAKLLVIDQVPPGTVSNTILKNPE